MLGDHIARARAHPRALREGSLTTDDGEGLRVERAKAPDGPPTFATIHGFVRVRGDGPVAGVLRIPIDAKAITGLIAESLRLARWDETTRRFHVLLGSTPRLDEGYVFGHVTRPGIYGVAGLPNDDRILATIDLMSTLAGWLGPDDFPGLVPKVCGLILCAEPGAGAAALGGDLCDICLGGGGRGVDLDLFGMLQTLPGTFVWPGGHPVPQRCDEWESAGPNNVPGRINALVAHPTDAKILYAGSAAGGVFKSTDRGGIWTPLWHDQLSLAIGGLGISASDPNVLYAATGEWVGAGSLANHFAGVGVYRTSDGGADWDLLAAIASTTTNAVAVDPGDPDRAYVAGSLALHRTRDGGRTWDVTAGHTSGVFDGLVTDVVVDPVDALRLYIGVHNDGVWRTTDGGNTWTKLTNGIGSGALAVAPKIALGRSGAHGTKFVAVVMDAVLYTSIDGGNSFTQRPITYPNAGGSSATWSCVVAVDPTDEQVIIAGRSFLVRSGNGGAAWTTVGNPSLPPWVGLVHSDQQAVVFDPTDHDRVFVANDGGVYLSTDNGRNWTPSSFGLVTTQCWTVSASAGSPTVLAVTTQDNLCYRSSPGSFSFQQILPFEGGIVEYDPMDPLVLYANTWYDNLKRSLNGGVSWTVIEPNPWLAEALAISRQDPQLLLAVLDDFAGLKPLRRSVDRGATWTTILAALNYPLTTVCFAPSDDRHAYVGWADGRVSHSEDRGLTMWDLPVVGLPVGRVQRIVVDWRDPKRFYVAFGTLGIRQLWRGDVGATANTVTWTDVSGRIAAASLPDLAITGIALHPTLEETIFVSNILGVYRSVDGGESWAPYDGGLPNCFVSDLDVRPQALGARLYASTMGRGIYSRRV